MLVYVLQGFLKCNHESGLIGENMLDDILTGLTPHYGKGGVTIDPKTCYTVAILVLYVVVDAPLSHTSMVISG